MFGSTSPRRFTLRRTALVGILVAAIGALGFTGAAAANAANGDSVGTFADIQGQVNLGYTPLHLSQTIDYNQSGGNSLLYIPGDETIDLNGFTLNVRGIVLGRGATVTFEDLSTSGGGRVATNGIGNDVPGIAVGHGSTLNVEDGVSIRATGAPDNAGIGSGNNVIDPQDQTDQTLVTGVGTINVDDGSLDVYAGSNSAAIGGGNGLAGGTLNIESGSTVTGTAGTGQSIIGAGAGGTGFGSLDVAGTLDISSGSEFDVPNATGIDVDSTGVIGGDGSLSVAYSAAIRNAGAITLPQANITFPNPANITGNNFIVTFDANQVDEPGALPASANSESVDVLAPTLAAGNRHAPTDYTGPGDYLTGWIDQDNPWDENTTITQSLTVLGTWAPLTSITVAAASASAPSTSSVALTVTGQGPSGITNDQTPFATYTSSVSTDTFGTGTVHLAATGSHVITAHVTSVNHPATSFASTNTASIIGTGTLASGMTITPLKPTIKAGYPATFVVSGKDAGGTSLGNVTSQVTWSGWSTKKHDSLNTTTNELTFGTAGTRTIKATIGSHSVSTTVKVIPGDPATLAFVKPVTKAVAGIPAAFTVDAKDFAGNSLGNVTNDSTFGVQNAVSGEFGSGNLVTFTLAGSRFATVTDGDATATTPITVVHTVGDHFDFTVHGFPFDPDRGPSGVAAGFNETYSIPLEDAYGNVFSDADLASTIHISFGSYGDSSRPDYSPITSADVVKKNTVTWTQAGSRFVHLADGNATLDLLQTVNAGPTVAKKLTFNFPTTTHYVTQSFSLSASPSDAYGNATDTSVAAAFTAGDKGATVIGSPGTEVGVTFTKTGKHTITAKATGYTSLSQSFTAIKDTSTPSFSVPTITADDASTDVAVALADGGSGITPGGAVTLTYGTKKLTSLVSGGEASFTLPKLKAGKYSFSASYSGDALYNSKSSAKVTVTVVPGVLASLKFGKTPTSVVAGTTVTYNVNGYDQYGNLIGSENDYASFDLAGSNGITDYTNGDQVRLGIVGTRTITATLGSFSVVAHVKVTIAPAHALVMGSDNYATVAGVPLTITATAVDAYGNSYGDVSKSLKLSSETTSTDKFSKNVATLTEAKYGDEAENHGIIAKYGKLTFIFTVAVSPAAAVPGKYAFDDSTTTANIGQELGLQLHSADKYGNPVAVVDPSDVVVTITPSEPINTDHNTVTFSALGTYTVSAAIGSGPAVTVTKTIKIVKGTASIQLASGTIVSTVGQHLTVTVVSPTESIIPTGTVVLHFGSTTFAAQSLGNPVANSASTTFTFTGPKAGSYKVYVTYSGDGAWNSSKSGTSTISVVPAL